MKLTLKFKGAVIRIDTVNQYDISLKDDEISISEVHHSSEVVDVVETVRENTLDTSTEYDHLNVVLKKTCDKSVVKQVRELLSKDISDSMFNNILSGVKKYLEYKLKDGDITRLNHADVTINTAMFAAAGYSYSDALSTLCEHHIVSEHIGGKVISDTQFKFILQGWDAYRYISDAIGITEN
jgi:hypothetical protein